MARVRLPLRSRRARQAESEVRAFRSWSLVGNLDSPTRVLVDPSGRLAIDGATWSLDWWVGAEDRWHRPADEAAVRQELVSASPVVETRVRIPSGDAVAHAYGARGPRGEDLAVLEVRNDSKLPVALALVVRPIGGGGIRSIRLQGPALHVDGAVLHLPRSPGRFALSTADDPRDATEVLLAGDAEPVRAHEVRCAAGAAQAVLLFPVAHTASLRVALPLGEGARPVDPGALPSAVQVASGWATHSRGGARIEVPDRRLREVISGSVRQLLLDGSDEPIVVRALAQMGLADGSAAGAGRPSRGWSTDEELGGVLAARADRWRLLRAELADGESAQLAAAIERWAQRGEGGDALDGRRALPVLAELFEAAGERTAAEDVRRIAAEEPAAASPPPPPIGELLTAAGPTCTWSTVGGPDPAAAARFLLAVRAHLVDDDGADLQLSPVVPDAWLGQGWEVHDLPTARGRLSFAIRWHGERPALLWELVPHPGEGPVRLTAPALDPAWSSTEAAGEALLAAVAVPERPSRRRGLTIPVAIEPMRRRA
jgi:hypothetical protein